MYQGYAYVHRYVFVSTTFENVHWIVSISDIDVMPDFTFTCYDAILVPLT